MYSRPRPGENEDDILKIQEEFLREKEKNKDLKPSAQVVNLQSQTSELPSAGKRGISDSSSRKPSKYAQAKGLSNHFEKRQRNDEINSSSTIGEIVEKNTEKTVEHIEDDKVYFPAIIPCVIGSITEKNDGNEYNLTKIPLSVPAKGFPTVKKRDLKVFSGKKSIFAQQIELARNSENAMLVDEVKPSFINKCESSLIESINVPERSYIVTSEDSVSIHKQNLDVLSKMTEKEILEEQKKLMSNLDPCVVKFLKSKRAQNLSKDKMDVDELPATSDQIKNSENVKGSPSDIASDDSLWENDILSHPNVGKWVHFDSLETDKLEWMKGIEESKKNNGNEPYEARFNFKGYLLPYMIEYNEETKTLFHHGEESHRPGYSLAELFELTRSSIMQQRVMSLNTLAGILEYYNTGIYKDIIDIPITKIFFVIRFAMDDNKIATLEPSLRAMRNLLFNRIDEACLDALLGLEEGLMQPCLEHDKSEVLELEAKESELKDFHLAEIDVITGAVRTDIVQRLHYILSTVRPTFNSVQYCLQILTRLARDSTEVALNIVNCEHLMNCIIHSFLPVTGINFPFHANIVYSGKPILAAVKLVRVLSLQSLEVAQILTEKYNIMESLSAYVSSGVDGTYGLRIQIEALAMLTNLLIYNSEVNRVFSLTPVLLTSLYKHVNGTDIHIHSSVISVNHASVLLQLISRILISHSSQEFKQQLYPLLKQATSKWISQLCSLEIYSCGHLKLVCATLDCVRTILNIEQYVIPDSGLENILRNLANSQGFKILLNRVKSSSNLLSNIESSSIHAIKNIETVGGTIIDTKHKVLPVLSFASPIPLLTALMKFLDSLQSRPISILFANQMLFYLTDIKTEMPSLCENWFTRIETDLLLSLLKILSIKSDISESEKDIVYAVANKMCYILRADKTDELVYLFDNVIFNKHWFTAERLLNIVSLEENDTFSKILTSIEEIKLCYCKVINLKFKLTGHCIVLRHWKETILPRDWIYLPIVKLYSEHQNESEMNTVSRKRVAAVQIKQKEFIVSRCLEWILFNELCFVNLLNDIDLTDRFCRLMCVFLCDNSLFLDKHISMLLEKCMTTLFKKEKKYPFNFDKDLTGLHNFQDFYTQFLEQFQSVSYGDLNFAACVFVPLAQKHSVKWRKLLWSEYAGCLRALDCPIERLCYNIDEYLYPEESDESLLKSYFNAMSSNLVRPNTLAHRIASHHINCFRKQKCSK